MRFSSITSCRTFFWALLVFLSQINYAQQKNIPLSNDADWLVNYLQESYIIMPPLNIKGDASVLDSFPYRIHSSFKPLFEDEFSFSKYSFLGSKFVNQKDTIKKHWLIRKLKHESLVNVNDTADKFKLNIDPLFNFTFSKDRYAVNNDQLYTNTRGVWVRGDIGEKFSFETSFFENQSVLPEYLNKFASTNLVVPGQGRWKSFKKNGYDYAMASGYISYSPSRRINIQLGHGKHFVGDGYRSLLLSDNAFNYPYLRITTNYKKLQYTNLYCLLQNLNFGGVTAPLGTEPLFQRKAAAFQYLNWYINKKYSVGIFQGMIWEASDKNNQLNLNLNYFNPLILVNSGIYGLSNKNNILLGLNAKAYLIKNVYAYGQFVLDDFNTSAGNPTGASKYGYQIGIRGFDIAGIKNLNALAEYNVVQPFTYAHADSNQSYTHYNQSLTHPLGAAFNELLVKANYRYNDFFVSAKFIASSTQNNLMKNSTTSYLNDFGNNVLTSDWNALNIGGNATSSSLNINTKMYDISLGYIINRITNMQIAIGFMSRTLDGLPDKSVLTNKTPFTELTYISLKTNIQNLYNDF